MKRLILIVGLLASCAWAQTTTTITGTLKDLTNAVVTSGKVTFTLTPNRDTTISGVARFTPTTITCLINGSGQIVAQDGVSVCTLTMNTALQPTGTYYAVAIWPYGVKTSSFTFYAVNSTYDWSTVVPTPATSPAQNYVDVFSNQTIGGAKNFTGANTFSGSSNAFPGPMTASSIDGLCFVDGVTYPTIAAAIAGCAGGAIVIPPHYAGTDVIANPGNLPIIDLRGGAELRIWSQLSTARPVLNFPLGADLRLIANGSADLYLTHDQNAQARTTTAAALGVGANTNIVVAGSTANFTSLAPIWVGRETATEELVSAWSIVDATHINLTCTKTHSGTTDIEQIGTTIFNNGSEWILQSTQPSRLVAYYAPVRLMNEHFELLMSLPMSLADPWPQSGIGITPAITGMSNTNPPAPIDLRFRNSDSSHFIKMLNSAGVETTRFNDAGLLTNISALTEIAAPAGVAAVGQDVCYGDSTAHAIKCSLNNGTFNNVAIARTATDTPGAITVNANTCTDRSVAVTGLLTSAVIIPTANYAVEAGIFTSAGQAVAGTAHYRICNVTVGNITLNAAATFNLAALQ